jgi:hypothetical protein
MPGELSMQSKEHCTSSKHPRKKDDRDAEEGFQPAQPKDRSMTLPLSYISVEKTAKKGHVLVVPLLQALFVRRPAGDRRETRPHICS